MVLLPSKNMESSFGFFAETLRSIIASGYFEIEPVHISALIFILDP